MPKLTIWKLASASIVMSILLSIGDVYAAPAGTLESSLQIQAQINSAAAQSQQRVDRIADETEQMLEEYLLTVQHTERLRIYNDHLEKLIRDQEDEKVSINQQLIDIEVVEKEIIPLMLRMIDSLEQFVNLDMPFQLEERTRRVNNLKEIMDRADVTISEKYRQVMEAYQIETDFGRNIEAYRGVLELEGEPRQVDFLRVGRVVLAYQTLDRSETGFWNKSTRQWEELDDDYRIPVTQGLRVARKQTAPELLKLPVPAPESVK